MSAQDGELSVGVVGLGYWGPNLARNVAASGGARLAWCCDSDPAASERATALLGDARLTDSLDEVLADEELDGVLLATPVRTHGELAVRVLAAGNVADVVAAARATDMRGAFIALTDDVAEAPE